jgi:hypothetical protein
LLFGRRNVWSLDQNACVCAGEICAVDVFQRSLDEGVSLLERRWAVANDKKGRTVTDSALLLYFATNLKIKVTIL